MPLDDNTSQPGQRRTPRCPGCGYNLTGLKPPLDCPECGRDVPNFASTQLPVRSRSAGTAMREPDWPAMLPGCPGCGYNLTGLTPPVNCPECGFAVDDKTLVLRGVLKTDATGSPARKALWVLIVTMGIIIAYGWMGLVLLGWYGLFIFLAWLAGFIVMIVTSKRDRAGRMAIIFTAGGFVAVADLSDPRHEGRPVPWDRVAGLRLDRVSPVWYRLQIWSATEKLLDAGVRCPDDDARLVYDTLEAYRTGISSAEVAG